jgi:hypothetical protein
MPSGSFETVAIRLSQKESSYLFLSKTIIVALNSFAIERIVLLFGSSDPIYTGQHRSGA